MQRTKALAFPLAFLVFALPIPLALTEHIHLVLRHLVAGATAEGALFWPPPPELVHAAEWVNDHTPATAIVATPVRESGLGYWLWGMTSLSLAIGVGLVIGGALGNLIDRLVYGRVADFFHFYGFGYDWYVFNIADVAITFGAVAIIYEVLKPAEA